VAGELLLEADGGLIVTPDADEQRPAAERRDVQRHIGGAAEPVLIALESDDWYRCLGRNAIHAADEEVVQHHVAHDGDGPADEA
jgi:hypothetical protein